MCLCVLLCVCSFALYTLRYYFATLTTPFCALHYPHFIYEYPKVSVYILLAIPNLRILQSCPLHNIATIPYGTLLVQCRCAGHRLARMNGQSGTVMMDQMCGRMMMQMTGSMVHMMMVMWMLVVLLLMLIVLVDDRLLLLQRWMMLLLRRWSIVLLLL